MKRKQFQTVPRGSVVIPLLVVVLVIGMVGYIVFKSTGKVSPKASAPIGAAPLAAPTPLVPVKDFAPNLPMSQKTTILIQTSDSSDIKYIVPTDQANMYVKNLPPGYQLISKK